MRRGWKNGRIEPLATKSGVRNVSRTKSIALVSRIAAAMALLIGPLPTVERAQAACSPPTSEAAPVSSTTVTCTGATTDQNADNVNTFAGYGTGNETAVTVNVGDATTSASVKSSSDVAGSDGIFIHDGTVNNFAGSTVTVAGTHGVGIQAFGNITVNNSGNINFDGVTGHGDRGVFADGTANVTNTGTGTILGLIAGVESKNGAVNVTNSGSIGSSAGPAIKAATTATVSNALDGSIFTSGPNGAISAGSVATVDNSGAITALGIAGMGVFATTINITANSGTISATGAGGIAVSATADATVTNGSGTISGDGTGISANSVTITSNSGSIKSTNGVAIFAPGAATVMTNSGTISGNTRGIASDGIIIVNGNDGTIEAGGSNGRAIFAATNATVTNDIGTIQGTGTSGIGILAGGTATVTNGTGGHITGDAFGVNANMVKVISNAGTIESTGVNSIAIHAGNTATVNNLNGGRITGGFVGIEVDGVNGLNVTNAVGGTIAGAVVGITGNGTVTNAGTITGGTNSVLFIGAGTNTLTLQTGSTLIGDAQGSLNGTNRLELQGNGAADNNFLAFDNLDVNASGFWTLNGNSTIRAGAVSNGTVVSSGTLVIDGGLTSPVVTVNSGGTLGGHGTVTGNISVASGGTVAPGAAVPFSTLTVAGAVTFQPGSVFRVNVNSTGQSDKLVVTGTNAADLTGGTVNVLAQNGSYAPSTQYKILTVDSLGVGGGNKFSNVTTNLAFLTPSLSYDPNGADVFLTLALTAGGTGTFGFSDAAQTRNQKAVAGALDASPISYPLITALLNQTIDGARRAFDALSGEVFGSVHNTQAGEAQFARGAMLGRLRQASYASAPGELGALGFAGPGLAYGSGEAAASPTQAYNAYAEFPTKAAPGMNNPSRDLTFWSIGLGGWGRSGSDGNAASLTSRFGGFLSGADERFGDTLRAGLVAGYMRSDLNVDARSSSAGVDSVQLGAYAGGRLGAFNVRGGASYSIDSIDTSRSVAFTGFTDQTSAHFHGNVGQVFGEIGYGMVLNQLAVEPLAGLAYVHLRDGSFLESGGAAALSGASTSENLGYSSLGLRAATALPLANGTVLVPRGSVQWQHAFGDVTPAAALAFQGTGTGFSVAGLPIARNTALVEGGFDWRFSPRAKLGASYQGELAAHAQTHAFKGAFTWDF